MSPSPVSERLKSLCEQCRAQNPGLYFWWDDSGVHLRDYAQNRDFLIYASVLGKQDIIDGSFDGKRYLSFNIPEEGPAKPPPWNIGDTIIDTRSGERYTVREITLIDDCRRYCMAPYWRAKGEQPKTDPHAWCGATLEQSETYWQKAS